MNLLRSVVVRRPGLLIQLRAPLCLDIGYNTPTWPMMSRQMQQKYRTGKQLGLWVSDEVADRLSALAERTKLPQSQLLREALELLFEKYERQRKEKKRGSQPA